MAKQTRTDYNVSPEKFIEVWETSETAQEVADRLGMPRPIALARASFYRKNGIPLSPMGQGHARELDRETLTAIALKYQNQKRNVRKIVGK